MVETSQLEKAKRAISRADMCHDGKAEFSVEEFSKDAVARLIAAMNDARKEGQEAS